MQLQVLRTQIGLQWREDSSTCHHQRTETENLGHLIQERTPGIVHSRTGRMRTDPVERCLLPNTSCSSKQLLHPKGPTRSTRPSPGQQPRPLWWTLATERWRSGPTFPDRHDGIHSQDCARFEGRWTAWKTTLSESLNTELSLFKHLTVK